MSAYKVDGYGGIAWRIVRNATEWTEESWEHIEGTDPNNEGNYYYNEPEEIEREDMVIMVMIGDDREFTIDRADITKLDDLAYCSQCGQIGCTHDGRERG